MAIRVFKEPKDICRKFGIPKIYENCCICHDKTEYWCLEKDVALCLACAGENDLETIPNKEQWFTTHQQNKESDCER